MNVYATDVLLDAMNTGKELAPGFVPLVVCQNLFEADTSDSSEAFKFAAEEFVERFDRLTTLNNLEIEGGAVTLAVMRRAAKYSISFTQAYLLQHYGDDTVTEDEKLLSMTEHQQFEDILYKAWSATDTEGADIRVVRRVLKNQNISDTTTLYAKLPDLVLACTYYMGG